MDNLLLGPDAQINHRIGVLRTTVTDQPLAEQLPLVPGAFVSIDREGEVAGRCVTGGESLLRLDYTCRKSPRWLALHLRVGGLNLDQAAIFGVVCKSRAPQAATFRLCLRSAAPAGFVDAFLPKHVVTFAETSTHVDLLQLQGHEDVPVRADWRELILFFQPQSAAFDLLDLRVFIV